VIIWFSWVQTKVVLRFKILCQFLLPLLLLLLLLLLLPPLSQRTQEKGNCGVKNFPLLVSIAQSTIFANCHPSHS
jgi:hypothetical protein